MSKSNPAPYQIEKDTRRQGVLRKIEAAINSGMPFQLQLTFEEYVPGTEEGPLEALVKPELRTEHQTNLEESLKREKEHTTELAKLLREAREIRDAETDRANKVQEKYQELMRELDVLTAPKEKKKKKEKIAEDIILPAKEIKAISSRSIVKKVEDSGEATGDAFEKVRKTKFYGDGPNIPKGYPKFPAFKGHSFRKGKWIFVKHPPEEHLAQDELPRLNIRAIRPRNAMLTTAEVWQVRRYIKSGRKNNWIEKRMGMTDASVSTLRTGKTFKNVPEERLKPEKLLESWKK